MEPDTNRQLERAYDDEPYPDYSFWFTHPDHLGMLGRLFGLASADAERCRVLEIGCAVGGNLLPMAHSAPEARFVGVDLSKVQIEAAIATAKATGLDNITFIHGDFREVPEDLGPFDYIICHGVFSWVDEPTQRAIARFMGERLAPGGVGYLSYNTYPGHHLVDMVRRLCRLHTQELEDPERRITESLSVMRWLSRRARKNQNDWRATFLEKELTAMQEAGRPLILHDYLASENHPLYFIDFVALCEQEGLSYLANASAWEMYLENQEPEVVEALSQLGDMVLQQQYLDFVHHTRFRRTLVCRAVDTPNREVHAARVMDMFLGSGLFEEPSLDGLAERMPVPIRVIGRPPLTVSSPLLRLALHRLWTHDRRWPSFATLAEEVTAELAKRGLEPELVQNPELLRARLAGQLLRAFFAEAVRFSLRSPPVAATVPSHPTTGRFQRYLAASDNPGLVNLCHEAFACTPFARTVLPAMDGTRSLEELRALAPEDFDRQMELMRSTGFILDPALARTFG